MHKKLLEDLASRGVVTLVAAEKRPEDVRSLAAVMAGFMVRYFEKYNVDPQEADEEAEDLIAKARALGLVPPAKD